MKDPVISVIGTVYNQAVHAERVLEVWCRQRFPHPYELIVMDDGSTDGTREMVELLARRYPDRIRYFYFDASHFTRNCTLLFNVAIRRLMRSEIAVIQWYDRIPGSLDALARLYTPHASADKQLVSFLTRHIAGSSSRDVFSDEAVDQLLASVPWRERPETLAAVMGVPGAHCHRGTMNESACFSVRRAHLNAINGYDERYFKVANYSNIELYGRLRHYGLNFLVLDEYTFHQPHPSNREDIQTPIEPESVVVRNTRIRQNWGAIVPADDVQPDRCRWTVAVPPDRPRPAWAATVSADIEVLIEGDPNRVLRDARGRMVCYTSREDRDVPAQLAQLDERARRSECGCLAPYAGRVQTEHGSVRLALDATAEAVHGDLFCVPRTAAVENGLAFDATLEPQLSRVDFSRQMSIWGGRINAALTNAPSPAAWPSEAFDRRWDFLAGG